MAVKVDDGSDYQEIAHTLDFTNGGGRLGAIRRGFRLDQPVTIPIPPEAARISRGVDSFSQGNA